MGYLYDPPGQLNILLQRVFEASIITELKPARKRRNIWLNQYRGRDGTTGTVVRAVATTRQ